MAGAASAPMETNVFTIGQPFKSLHLVREPYFSTTRLTRSNKGGTSELVSERSAGLGDGAVEFEGMVLAETMGFSVDSGVGGTPALRRWEDS